MKKPKQESNMLLNYCCSIKKTKGDNSKQNEAENFPYLPFTAAIAAGFVLGWVMEASACQVYDSRFLHVPTPNKGVKLRVKLFPEGNKHTLLPYPTGLNCQR